MAFPAGIVGGGEEPSARAPPPPQLPPPPHRNHAVLGPKIRGSSGGNVQPAPVGRWRRRHFFSSMLGQMEQQNGGEQGGGASGEEKQPEHPVIRWIKLIGPHGEFLGFYWVLKINY